MVLLCDHCGLQFLNEESLKTHLELPHALIDDGELLAGDPVELFSLLLALAECLPTRCRTKPPSPDLLGAMESSTNLLSGVWQLQVILAKADQFTLG